MRRIAPLRLGVRQSSAALDSTKLTWTKLRCIGSHTCDIFDYFDAYQVGLTATPVKFILRDTYGIFDCDPEDPTFNYDYNEGVDQRYLVPFEVETHTTPFLRQARSPLTRFCTTHIVCAHHQMV